MNKEKLIIDLALGDGYLSKPRTDKSNSRLVLKHSSKQTDYLLYKKDLLEKNGFKCSIDSYTDQKGYNVVQVRTMSNIIVKNVYNKLYPNNKKTITKEILKNFDAHSLAILFQDDGSREHTKFHRYNGNKYAVKPYINAFTLYLNCFTNEENMLILSKFLEMGIEARITQRKGYSTIIISKVEAKEKFVELVKPLLYSSMLYKIDTPVKYHGDL